MTNVTTKSTRFGDYIRRARVDAGRSLREVADEVGISHVYLGEVERGVRGPLIESHWDALIAALPKLKREELERTAQMSRALQLDLPTAPTRYQDLALALARRFKKRDLSEADLTRLLKVLKSDE
jgi:transcriptional regulator with XRE-family HTH domain